MKATVPVKSSVDRSPENLVARVTFNSARCLGSATRTARDGLGGIGRLIREGPGVLIRYSRVIGQRIRGRGNRPVGEEPPPTREGIRSIIIEELARWQDAAGATSLGDLEKSLRRMAETIEALEKRISELSSLGPIREADLWKELNSLEAAESLTGDERALLVGVFRRNLVLQKHDAPYRNNRDRQD